jgi:hypothetical protein
MKSSNWRNSVHYEFTQSLDAAGWAWEFLRRNPEYSEDYHNWRSLLCHSR